MIKHVTYFPSDFYKTRDFYRFSQKKWCSYDMRVPIEQMDEAKICADLGSIVEHGLKTSKPM